MTDSIEDSERPNGEVAGEPGRAAIAAKGGDIEVRQISIGGQPLQVAIKRGSGSKPPLLLLPDIDEDDYKLLIDGLVDDKRPWTLDRLYALPQEMQITRLVCVEGWSAIGKWIAAHCAASREADASPPLILFHALPV